MVLVFKMSLLYYSCKINEFQTKSSILKSKLDQYFKNIIYILKQVFEKYQLKIVILKYNLSKICLALKCILVAFSAR